MNQSQFQGSRAAQPRTAHVRRLAARAAAALCSAAWLLSATPAMATVIDFSSLAPSAHLSGETLSEAGYNMLLQEGPVGAFYGVVSGTGTVADANNPYTCDVIGCPGGGDGKYLMVLNDGAVRFSRADNIGGFTFGGLDLAFLTPAPVPNFDYGRLRLSGTQYDGSVASIEVAFPGQDAGGVFQFGSGAITPDFSRLVFSSLRIDACLFNNDNVCVNDLDNPAFNQAQFAIDNLTFSEVPEPASILLTGFAIGALALQRRRRAAATAVKGA
jgi:hypothetical protein